MIPDGHQLVIPSAAKSPYCSGGMALVTTSDKADAGVDTSAESTSERGSDVGVLVGTTDSVCAIDGTSVAATAASGVADLACATGSGVCWEGVFTTSEVAGFDHQ